MSARDIKAEPWCWQSKVALRRIREGCEDITYLSDVLAVYVSLTEIASDRQSETFDVGKREIGKRAGVKERRAYDAMDRLRALGVLSWRNNFLPDSKAQLFCTYTLTGPHAPLAVPPAPGAVPPAKTENADFAESEIISLKNPSGKSLKVATTKPASPAWSPHDGWQGVTDAMSAEWKEAYPACDISRQLAAMEQWLKSNPTKAKKSNWRRFITGWLTREQDRGGDMRQSGRQTTTGGIDKTKTIPLKPEEMPPIWTPK